MMQATSLGRSRDVSFRSRRPDLPVLTALRFFAAAQVTVYHCGFSAVAGTGLEDFFSNGYQSVSFFFVLSGFILAYVYPELTQAYAAPLGERQEFWIRRFLRIYPAYLLALLISFPGFVYAGVVSKTVTLLPWLGGLITVPLLLQAWFPPLAGAWNTPAWSLSVEGFFYACFPFSGRLFRNSNLVLTCALSGFTASAVGLIFRPDLHSSQSWHNFVAYFPLLHLPKFIFGVALGRIYLSKERALGQLAEYCFIGSAMALILVFGFRSKIPWWFVSDVFLVPLFGLIIYAGARGRGWVTKVLSHRWLVELGDASYGLYILHIPLFFWWARFTTSEGGHVTRWREISRSMLFFVTAIVVSLASHRLLEPVIRRYLRRTAIANVGR